MMCLWDREQGSIKRIYDKNYWATYLKIQREAQLDMMQALYEAKKKQAEFEEEYRKHEDEWK